MPSLPGLETIAPPGCGSVAISFITFNPSFPSLNLSPSSNHILPKSNVASDIQTTIPFATTTTSSSRILQVPSDTFSPFSPFSPRSAFRTNVRRRDDTRHEDPSKWVDGDLISYVHSTYPAADSAPLQELIRVNRLTPQALWYLQTEHEELTRLVSEESLQRLVLSLAQTIKPAVSPTTPRIRHVRRLSEDLARPPPPPPPTPPPPEEPELLDDNDLAESVVSDWALDDLLEDPEEAPEAHATHEAAGGDATASAEPAAGENILGLNTGAEDTTQTAPEPQPAPPQDTDTEDLVNLDSEDDTPQTTYGAESQAPPGAFAQAEDSASDYLSADLQHDAEEDMTRADGAAGESPSQHQEPHVTEPTEELPSDDINRADPPVPGHEHEDTNANAGAGEDEAQDEGVHHSDNPNLPGAFRAEPDDDDNLGDPSGKADETTRPEDPEPESTSTGRTEEHEQEVREQADREQKERDKTVEPEPVNSVPPEESKPPAESVPAGGEPSGEAVTDEQQPTPPAEHVDTDQPANQTSPETPVPAGGEPAGGMTDEQQPTPPAEHVDTDQPGNQTPSETPEQTTANPLSQDEPERSTGQTDSATSVPTTSQAGVEEHEKPAQRDEESEHAAPAPVPANEASGVEADGGQSGAAGDTQASQDSEPPATAPKTEKSLPLPPDASRETTSTETGASTQDDPAVVVGQQNEKLSGVSAETSSSQQASESTPTPKATETTEPVTQLQGAEETERTPDGASADGNVTAEGESRPSASQTLDDSSTDARSKDVRVDTTAPTTAPAPEGSRPSLSANLESVPPTPATEGPSSPVQGGGAMGGEEQTGEQTGAAEREAKRQAKKARQAEKAKAKAKAKEEAEEAERKAKAEAEEAERKAKAEVEAQEKKAAKKAKREAEKQAKRRGQQGRNAEQTVDKKEEVQDSTGVTKVGVEEGESNEAEGVQEKDIVILDGQLAKPSETTTLGSDVGINSTAMPHRESQTHSLTVASHEKHPTQLTSNETSSQWHSNAPQELGTPEHEKMDQSTSSGAASVPAGTISQSAVSAIVPQTNRADAEEVHDNEEPTKPSGINPSPSGSTSSNLVNDGRVTSHTSAPSFTPSHTGRAPPSSSSSTFGRSLPSLRIEQHGTGKASSNRAFTQQHTPSHPTSPAVHSPAWGLFSSLSSSITNVWLPGSSPSGLSPRHSSQERDVPPVPMSTSSLSTPYQQRSPPGQQSLSSVVSSSGTPTVGGSRKAGHPLSPVVGQQDTNSPQPSPSQIGDGNPSATVSEKDISDALSSSCLVSGDGPSDNTPSDAQTEETLTALFDQQKADDNQGGTADADGYVKVEVEDADDGAGNMGDDDDDEDNQPLSRLTGSRKRRQSTVAARMVDGDQSDAEDSTKPPSPQSRARMPLHARLQDIAGLDGDESSPTTPTTTDAFGNESTETGTTSSALLSGSQKRRQRKKKKSS
ncbi:hypothetical protein C8Q74DRAFT_1366556 [Fomes fomentarius]|nr:hypothetical protein C8Q74DRAFT_1366556 [Fomes fomentarius]